VPAPLTPRAVRSGLPSVPIGQAPATLADRQAALVAALVAGAPDPAGFDTALLDATRRALLRKRAGEAARHWPVLAASFGPRWYAEFALRHAGHEPGGGLRDGWDVALAHRTDLTADAVRELGDHAAQWRYDGRSTPQRRRLGGIRLALARRLGR
jgi:hypothetical protein